MKPVVGIVCDRYRHDSMAIHSVNDEYVAAIAGGADALPLLIPATDTPLDIGDILPRVDGLLFTGAPSIVSPARYGGPPLRDASTYDETRDATSLALIRAAIAAGKPLLAICRGFQELNVALGGTLHQHVHEIAGRLDHREDESAPPDVQYGPAHPVRIAEGGMLAGLYGAGDVTVNSLHHQGIDRLAPPLRAEAAAPDGQIEAVSLREAKGFVLGLQWHPEWRWSEHALSRAIFAAFGQSLRGA
jgi:putative glutamine amidotransferase